jgi:hypothetical protein
MMESKLRAIFLSVLPGDCLNDSLNPFEGHHGEAERWLPSSDTSAAVYPVL